MLLENKTLARWVRLALVYAIFRLDVYLKGSQIADRNTQMRHLLHRHRQLGHG